MAGSFCPACAVLLVPLCLDRLDLHKRHEMCSRSHSPFFVVIIIIIIIIILIIVLTNFSFPSLSVQEPHSAHKNVVI